jgi:predicted AAA+ superfamily ATPase
VGKSTLLESLRPELSINLADPATFRDYLADPGQLEREISGKRTPGGTVFIDEVQRIPELLDAIQVILDRAGRKPRFLLSGSSARKLRRGQANLLPGRVVVHHMHPLVAAELGEEFDLDRAHDDPRSQAANRGLPGSARSEDRRRRSDAARAVRRRASALSSVDERVTPASRCR